MIEWAKRAGALVFQDAESLCEDNIVTFCVLGTFWYAQGSWRLSYLHKGSCLLDTATQNRKLTASSERLQSTPYHGSLICEASYTKLSGLGNSAATFLGLLSHAMCTSRESRIY